MPPRRRKRDLTETDIAWLKHAIDEAEGWRGSHIHQSEDATEQAEMDANLAEFDRGIARMRDALHATRRALKLLRAARRLPIYKEQIEDRA